ncbi:MAG: GH3 auxin-responsive promoter family protein [Bacteroidetes bacterium]|nr:GH3 auxin-responsive promoter family protein [Bacteroidota bacterium]
MQLINTVLTGILKRRIKSIDHFRDNPFDIQERCFKNLIDTAKNTEWGRQYGFGFISGIESFRERVPVNDYNSLKPYIFRIQNGEKDILWPGGTRWFAKSSGTTSDKSKYIPVSREALTECHFKGGKDLFALYFHNYPGSRMFDGKGIGMGGCLNRNNTDKGYYYDGDLSAVMMKNLPIWAELARTPGRNIALMKDWENKIEKMATVTTGQNITNLLGVPSWTLLFLKKVLEKTGKSSIHEVWPNLEVFFHGGVNFNPYREQFRKIIPSGKMNYIETYNASEGFFGIQDQLNSDEMLLMLDYGIFYEFMPHDQIDSSHPNLLTLADVRKEVDYALVISTNAGLWRYIIGDTIRFTSLNPFRIQISGRTKNFINAVGEEVIVDNAEKALTIACQKCPAAINEYTAAPIYFDDNHNASHEWLIEFATTPADMEAFTDAFDHALMALNSDYEAKRFQNMVLRRPVIRQVPEGTFYNWLKKKGKLGGQNKVPRLSNDRKFVEEILVMI